MANYTRGSCRKQYYYVLTIWYPNSSTYELYTSNDLRDFQSLAGIIVRSRHLNKLNHYTSKVLGPIYFTIERYDTGTRTCTKPRKRRARRPTKAYKTKCFLFSSYSAYTPEQLKSRADEYWQNHFQVQLSSLIDAIERGDISIEDIIPKDISDLHDNL